jgi:cell division transport system permease protein
VPRLGYGDIFSVAPILLAVGAAVAALTGYLTLRLYVRT